MLLGGFFSDFLRIFPWYIRFSCMLTRRKNVNWRWSKPSYAFLRWQKYWSHIEIGTTYDQMKILILTTSATQKAVIRHPTIFCVQSHQIYTVSLSRRTSLSELLHIVFRKLQLFSNSRFVTAGGWVVARLLFCYILCALLFVFWIESKILFRLTSQISGNK